jgi:hypothetical protein
MRYSPSMIAVLCRILCDEPDLANWDIRADDDVLRLAA